MLRGILKKPGGETLIEFDIPTSLGELRLNRFIDFLVECRAMDDDDVNHAEAITKAVGAFTGAPIADIVKANFETYTENGLLDSVSKVFAYALKLVSEAKGELTDPGNTGFQYKGETFVIPTILSQALAGEVILPGLSTIEVIEVAEVNRFKHQVTTLKGDPDGRLRKKVFDMFAQAIEVHGDKGGTADAMAKQTYAKELEKVGDPDGSLLFTNYVKTLAILCRKPGENLPVEDSAREVWIQNRTVFFSDIDAKTALNVDFFLTSILQNSENEVPAGGFLSRQSFAVVAATWLKKGKRTTDKRRTAKTSLKRSAGGR
jgi:hypothetical protein